MKDKESFRLKVDVSCLEHEFNDDWPEYLDFETGRILPEAACPEEERGVGRHDFAAGKRYIRVMGIDEAVEEIAESIRQLNLAMADYFDSDEDQYDPAVQQPVAEPIEKLKSCDRERANWIAVGNWFYSLKCPFPIDFVIGEYGLVYGCIDPEINDGRYYDIDEDDIDEDDLDDDESWSL